MSGENRGFTDWGMFYIALYEVWGGFLSDAKSIADTLLDTQDVHFV